MRKETWKTNFGLDAKGTYGGELKHTSEEKEGKSTISFNLAKKAEAGGNFGYSGSIEAEYKMNYVDTDFSGF